MHRWTMLGATALMPLLAGCITLADFSPDGQRVAVGTPSGTVVHDIASGGTQTVGPKGPCIAPAWSPDGRRIALFVGDPAHGFEKQSRLCIHDLTSGRTTTLPAGFGPPFAWRDDGTRFVCRAEIDGKARWVWYNLPERGITQENERAPEPLSQDNACVAYVAGTDSIVILGSDSNIHLVEGNEVQRLTTSADVIGMRVASDGRRLTWVRKGLNPRYIVASVYAYDLPSRSVRKLAFPDRIPAINPDPRRAPVSVDGAAVAPAGQRLAITVTYSTGKGGTARAVFVMGLDGAGARLVHRTDPSTQPDVELRVAWAPDGRHLTITEMRGKRTVTRLYRGDGSAVRVLSTSTWP